MPDYRELIEQVQKRGGPLRLGTVQRVWGDGSEYTVVRWGEPGQHVSLALQDMYLPEEDKDVLCGVLRRDLVQHGYDVAHFEHAWESTEPDGPSHDVQVYKPLPGMRVLRPQRAHDSLTAHLYAWLEAVQEEATRGP